MVFYKKYMQQKILILIGILIFIPISTIVSVYFNNDLVCNSYSCYDFLFGEKYVFYFFTPLFISASLLLTMIFSEKVFNIWKKFAIVATPLMIIGILLVKVNPVACGVLFCIDRTFMILLSGIIYSILSLLTLIISAVYFGYKK